MASTEHLVGDNISVKQWGRKLARTTKGITFFDKFMGESDSSLIQVKPETGKDIGDKVTFTLRDLGTGDGRVGDNNLEGFEEALTTYTDSVLLDQLRHSFRSSGRMSEQRVTYNHREEAMMALADWWAERRDTIMMNHLAGNLRANPDTVTGGAETTTAYNGHNTITDATAGRKLYGGGVSNDQSCTTSTQAITLSMIDNCVALAKIKDSNGNPRIRPIMVDGQPRYVVFLHPGQMYTLRTTVSSSAVTWYGVQQARLQGGVDSDNPILTGAEGLYNGTLLYESSYIPNGFNSSTYAAVSTCRRAVFCGAQAGSVAFGSKDSFDNMNWQEKAFDYGNQLGVAAGCISGMKKNVFNSKDFATIVLSTYSAL